MGIIYGIEDLPNRNEKYIIVKNDIVENVDVCIIGSGAAGAVLAKELVESGKKVVLLEKGGYYEGKDMNQRELDMMPLLWKNSGFNFDDSLQIAIAQGCCLGGSTIINDAVCIDPPQRVIDEWKNLGVDFTEEEWKNHLNKVKDALYVRQVTNEELNRNNMMLKIGAEKIGLREHSNNFRNCKNCMQCGFCHLGCHYETKQNVLVTYIHSALQKPDSDMRIYCNCSADDLIYTNGNIEGVEGNFVDRDGNKTYRIRINSKIVIVSAGAIASSKILLRNAIAQDRAGKGICLQPAIQVIGDFDYEIKGNEGIPMAYTIHDFGSSRKNDESVVQWNSKGREFLIESVFLPLLQFSIGLAAGDIAQHRDLMLRYNNYAMAGIVVRDENNGQLTTTLSGRTSLSYKLGQAEAKSLAKGVEILSKIWFALGAKKVIIQHRAMNILNSEGQIPVIVEKIIQEPDGLLLGSAHPQSGNKIGINANESVVDSNCKVHGFNNLFVCDASVFPTSVGVNTQISVMVVASIISSRIIKDWDNICSHFSPPASLGSTCSLTQPMHCLRKNLSDLFQVTQTKRGPEGLINSHSEKIEDSNWSYDPVTNSISNNSHWKGIFPRDSDIPNTLVTYTGGFWKRFEKDINTGEIAGITHPYEVDVRARNRATGLELQPYGKVILLEYLDFPFNQFFDILKIVDDNNVIGKAFLGHPKNGIEMLSFSMSRKYPLEFMDEEDHSTLFSKMKKPSFDSMLGIWEGRLVSDSAWSPPVFRFRFYYDNSQNPKIFKNDYVFGNLLAGTALLTEKEDVVEMNDVTGNFHDEMRRISDTLIIGKYYSTPNHVLSWLPEGLTFIHIDKNRSSIFLPYILRKIG